MNKEQIIKLGEQRQKISKFAYITWTIAMTVVFFTTLQQGDFTSLLFWVVSLTFVLIIGLYSTHKILETKLDLLVAEMDQSKLNSSMT